MFRQWKWSSLSSKVHENPLRINKPKFLLATNNPGKIRELVDVLSDVSFVVTTPSEEGIELDVEETGATFEENATIKANAFAAISGLLSIADDSGLEVDALGGEPGPLSARYAGRGVSDEGRMQYLLGKLQGIEWKMRGARFRSVIAVAEPDGSARIFEGVCEGVITMQPKGNGGFGYDPVFYVSSLQKLMSELSVEEKNNVSHRGIAARKAMEYLKGLLANC